MAPPGTLGQFHALLESPPLALALLLAGPAWLTGRMYLLLRFSDEDMAWAVVVPEAGGLWEDGLFQWQVFVSFCTFVLI